MILTPIRRYGAMILMLLTLVFSSEVLAKTHTTTASQKSHLTKASNKQVSSKQEYSRNSAKSSSLPDPLYAAAHAIYGTKSKPGAYSG